MGILTPNPITAPREVAPRDGLGGAVGLGVQVADQGADPLDPDGRWRLGYRLWGPGCASSVVATAGVCAPVGYGPSFVAPRWSAGPASAPFVIRSGIGCSLGALAAEGLDAWRAEASRMLDLTQWTRVAHELWTGEQAYADGADNRRLASPEADVLGESLGLVEAVARIEDALGACTGDVAVIHVPRRLVPYLAAAGLISSVTGQTARLFTHNGSLIVADRGYPGTGPFGQAPTSTSTWIYGTPVLAARIDPTTTFPAAPGREATADVASAAYPSTNDAVVIAERLAAISWRCCHVTASVSYCA